MSVRISSRRLSMICVAAVAVSAATVPSLITGSASASGSTLHVSGPTSNVMHTDFNETISGVAVSPANYVVAWEQFYKHGGCASTFAAESTRTFFQGHWGLSTWLAKPVSPGHHYNVVAAFGAQNLGTHGMCAYLINLASGTTYAHGQIWWYNHN